MATLFDKVGGFATVSKIVTDFYEEILDDDELAGYFEHVDLKRLIDHQTKFIATVMGGPASYSNEALRQVHAHVAINRPTYERVRDILDKTLNKHGVSAEDRAEIIAEFEERSSYVVNQ